MTSSSSALCVRTSSVRRPTPTQRECHVASGPPSSTALGPHQALCTLRTQFLFRCGMAVGHDVFARQVSAWSHVAWKSSESGGTMWRTGSAPGTGKEWTSSDGVGRCQPAAETYLVDPQQPPRSQPRLRAYACRRTATSPRAAPVNSKIMTASGMKNGSPRTAGASHIAGSFARKGLRASCSSHRTQPAVVTEQTQGPAPWTCQHESRQSAKVHALATSPGALRCARRSAPPPPRGTPLFSAAETLFGNAVRWAVDARVPQPCGVEEQK